MLDEPEAVAVVDELRNGDSSFLDGFEIVHIEVLLLQRPVKAFEDPIALGTSDEGWRELQTQRWRLSFREKILHRVTPSVTEIHREQLFFVGLSFSCPLWDSPPPASTALRVAGRCEILNPRKLRHYQVYGLRKSITIRANSAGASA